MDQKIVARLLLVAAAAVVVFFSVFSHRSPRSPATYGIDRSPAAQQQRTAWIQTAIATGIFTKLEPDRPVAWVGTTWYDLDYEQKEKAAGVVLAQYHLDDAKNDLLLLKDSRTGKRVGFYSLQAGLDLD